MNKRIIRLVFVLVIIITLPGCGLNKSDSNSKTEDKKENKQSIEKDINNDGVKEKISISFESIKNNSLDDYTITINSKGKEYKIKDEESNVNPDIVFADFNTEDNFIEFYVTAEGPSGDPSTTIFQFIGDSIKKVMKLQGYITSYSGKGKILTDFSKTNDKNKILLSYYELGKGVIHPDKKEIIGSYLQYDSRFILFKTDKEGMSYIDTKDDEELNKLIAEREDKEQVVKVTNKNEKLKIVDVDYEAYSQENNVINIPIKVQGEDGKEGWLMWLNGGD
ncbi:MAG: hypothetical protein H7Y18_02205 [Clostridiaceae bacterium]|nr:hypothetical protein [Clostridiaceae bacterium]